MSSEDNIGEFERAVARSEEARRVFLEAVKSEQGGKSVMEAYCVKCKAKREIRSPQAIVMKNGKPATTGTCPQCGTKVFRIGSA